MQVMMMLIKHGRKLEAVWRHRRCACRFAVGVGMYVGEKEDQGRLCCGTIVVLAQHSTALE